MPEPRRGQVQAGLAVGKGTDHAGPSSDLAHDPLERVVGAELDPVAVGEGVVGQSLADVGLDELRRAHKTLAAELVDHRLCLVAAARRLSWAWIALNMWLTSRTLVDGT